MLPVDVHQDLTNDKMNRFQAEAENYRVARAVKAGQTGSFERLMVAISHGLATIGETFKRDTRPSLPAV